MSPSPNCEKIRDTTFFDSSDDELTSARTAIHWFRRCLRFHDNPALSEAINISNVVKCVYIIDPTTISTSSKIESNKWRFLLESLRDLDDTLRKHNSRLYVLQGQPTYVLPSLFKHWDVSVLSIEEDPTPYGAQRDKAVCALAEDHGVYVVKRSSHTLHPISRYISLCAGKTPSTKTQFAELFKAAGKPDYHIETTNFDRLKISSTSADYDLKYGVPSFKDLGIPKPADNSGVLVWHGGEVEALKRLAYHLERRAWVARFEKPRMVSRSLMASPTGLGPYLNFGCLSSRLLYWKMEELYKQIYETCESSPISLHGQLILREFYYLAANVNKHFDQVAGNKLCMQVPWKKTNIEVMKRLTMADTGFPWIDAIIKQLVNEGWIHGIAKRALISFITYGQLFFSWEEAAKLLDTYCLEGDICTNNGISMLFSGTCFANQLPSNIGNPVFTGKYIDPTADFIRHYMPILRSFPAEYIYEPWTAPLDIQQQAGCVVGHDYPAPMLDHYHTFHTNIFTLQQFLKAVRERNASRKRHSNSAHVIQHSIAVTGTLAFSHETAKITFLKLP